ncbi:DUF192 domain-containing protein [Candidatus Woesearchaeota archaeon]|nr:DUF192 domain-containing protein [Candidatus Woesearchaeota archaeon]
MRIYKFIVIIFILATLFLYGCSKYVIINGKKINVEIADTLEKRANGLMFRESLDENSGMLFVYDNPEIRNFWMKNTLIPLDILFIDENKTIKKIILAEPCKKEPCKIYSSDLPVKYVLEVNGNYTTKMDIKEGGIVLIKFLNL